MVEIPQRKVIRVHSQAMGMLGIVRRHLERFPQDSALFAIDFERALQDLGFDLSRGMREHLMKRLHPPVPDGGELYEAVKQGRTKLPGEIRIRLGRAASEGELKGMDPNGPGVAIVRSFSKKRVTERAPIAVAGTLAVPRPPDTAGYSILVQLTDDIVNRVIGVAYDEGLIPHDWTGSYQLNWPMLRAEIDVDYDIDFQKPTIDLNTPYVNGVALNLAATSALKLTFSYLDFPFGSLPTVSDTLLVNVNVSARAVGSAEIRNSGSHTGAVYLNLVDLEDLDVTLSGATLPPLVEQLIVATIRRIAQVGGAGFVLPLSFDFERVRRAGVPIHAVASRIRQPSGGRPGTLTIAIDTTGNGDPTAIPHIIPGGDHFGFAVTEHFLVGQAWPIIRNQEFPREEDGVKLYDPDLDLRDNYIYFFLKATKEIDCLPDVDAEAEVHLVFESFVADGVHRTRLKSVYEDIELDLWDRLFYTLLLGLLLGGVGGVGVGVIGMIVFNVIIAVLEGKGETAIGNAIQESSVGFRNKIPGTNIVAEASTPIAPTIYNGLIHGYGDAVIYPEP